MVHLDEVIRKQFNERTIYEDFLCNYFITQHFTKSSFFSYGMFSFNFFKLKNGYMLVLIA